MTVCDSVELKRLRWRSRRGLLELDLVLERFFSGPFFQLNPGAIEAYRRLLDLPDIDFLDVVSGTADLEDPDEMAVVAILRSL